MSSAFKGRNSRKTLPGSKRQAINYFGIFPQQVGDCTGAMPGSTLSNQLTLRVEIVSCAPTCPRMTSIRLIFGTIGTACFGQTGSQQSSYNFSFHRRILQELGLQAFPKQPDCTFIRVRFDQ